MDESRFRLDHKVAVVTGGTSGLGRSIALALSAMGADVIPVGRHIDRVEQAASEIASQGSRTLAIAADVTKLDEIDALIQAVVKEFGRIDVLVNSAGTHLKKPAFEVNSEEWDQIQDTNLKATFFVCQRIARVMRDQGGGSIINLSSVASFTDFAETSVYGSSKAAVDKLTASLACEWAPFGIRVNAIAPGVFVTPMNEKLVVNSERGKRILEQTPMGRFGTLDEIQGAAVFLASESARFITGVVLPVDGGFLARGI
jgi:NAD(P)-dependent dehydrogenase (short-subunit alcohol dehydrogenase family)